MQKKTDTQALFFVTAMNTGKAWHKTVPLQRSILSFHFRNTPPLPEEETLANMKAVDAESDWSL